MPPDLYWNRLHAGQQSILEKNTNGIENLRRQLMIEALGHVDCPLTQKEIVMILKRIKIRERKGRVLGILSKVKKALHS